MRPDGRSPPAVDPATGPATRRPIEVDGASIGEVVVTGSGPGSSEVIDAVASTVATALGVAAAQASARRAVTAAALDDLRELSLLSRLAETVGSVVEPEQIALRVLETIARPLHADVAIVLPPDADGPGDPPIVAAIGGAADAAQLAGDARPLIARLRAEDPVQGTCAELDRPAATDAFGSLLAAVVRTTRGTQGVIVLGRRPAAPAFGDTDRRLLAAVASQTAIALERSVLQREILGRRRLDDELAIGRRIQRSLMPRRFPSTPGWEIAAAYEAAREIGGDLYDVFRLREETGRLAFSVADVTGKGIPAAILMADVRGLIHAGADHTADPAETLSRVNRILVDERRTSLFVTVALGVLDTVTRRAGAGERRSRSGPRPPLRRVADAARATGPAHRHGRGHRRRTGLGERRAGRRDRRPHRRDHRGPRSRRRLLRRGPLRGVADVPGRPIGRGDR